MSNRLKLERKHRRLKKNLAAPRAEKAPPKEPVILRLDLACGARVREGFVGVDLAKDSAATIHCDLGKAPWPFEDNSADEVCCDHFIEHLPGVPPRDSRIDKLVAWLKREYPDDTMLDEILHPPPEGRCAFFNELHRVMKPGAKAVIVAPHWGSMRSVMDPTHAWPPVCEGWPYYLNLKWRTENGLTHYLPLTCDFDFSYVHNCPVETAQRTPDQQQFRITHYMNSVADLIFTLVKREPEEIKQPGDSPLCNAAETKQ